MLQYTQEVSHLLPWKSKTAVSKGEVCHLLVPHKFIFIYFFISFQFLDLFFSLFLLTINQFFFCLSYIYYLLFPINCWNLITEKKCNLI